MSSFLLLSGEDLKDLGFPLGPRKLLQKFIESKQNRRQSAETNNHQDSETTPSSPSDTATTSSASGLFFYVVTLQASMSVCV